MKEMIIKTLKDFGRLPTGRIAGIIGKDYPTTLEILKDLGEEKKILMEKETTAVYWRINNKRKREAPVL